LFESNKGSHSGAVQTAGQHFYLYGTFNSVEDSIPESSYLYFFSDHTFELPSPPVTRRQERHSGRQERHLPTQTPPKCHHTHTPL